MPSSIITKLTGSGTVDWAVMVAVTPKLSTISSPLVVPRPNVMTFVNVYKVETGAMPKLPVPPAGFGASPAEVTEYIGGPTPLNVLVAE
jgi:hypothetical protein